MMVHGRKKCNEYICQDQEKAGKYVKKKITNHRAYDFRI